jgi:uncharacterized protein YpmB
MDENTVEGGHHKSKSMQYVLIIVAVLLVIILVCMLFYSMREEHKKKCALIVAQDQQDQLTNKKMQEFRSVQQQYQNANQNSRPQEGLSNLKKDEKNKKRREGFGNPGVNEITDIARLDQLERTQDIEYEGDTQLSLDYKDTMTGNAVESTVVDNHKKYVATIKRNSMVPKIRSFRQEPQSAFYSNFVGLRRPRAPRIRDSAYQMTDDLDANDYEDSRRNVRNTLANGLVG